MRKFCVYCVSPKDSPVKDSFQDYEDFFEAVADYEEAIHFPEEREFKYSSVILAFYDETEMRVPVVSHDLKFQRTM